MFRFTLLAGLVALGASALAAGAPPDLPRDTLPAKLALDEVPLGLEPRPVCKDNPLTEQRVMLGRRLFFDPILSADNTVACASCHHPDHGFAGIAFFWDGREATLEGQALRPIEDPAEMGSTVAAALDRLRANPAYKSQFEAAFADGVTALNLSRALASFERVLLRGDSVIDRFRRKGEHTALTVQERQGLWLYESKGRCWRCHSGANFTDEAYHNTGVSWGKNPLDLGRFAVTKKEKDRGRFKTPTLRGVALTGPYMHDGSLTSLEAVIEFYNRGGGANPNLDPVLAPLNLSKDEIRSLAAFLRAL